MRLTTENLLKLAELYGVSITQLASPPDAAGLVSTLDEVQTIIEKMAPETLAEWLSLGRKLSGK